MKRATILKSPHKKLCVQKNNTKGDIAAFISYSWWECENKEKITTCAPVCGPPAQRRTSLANVSLRSSLSRGTTVNADSIGPCDWSKRLARLESLLQPKSGAVSSSGASSSSNSRRIGAFNSFTKGEIQSFIQSSSTPFDTTHIFPPASVGRGDEGGDEPRWVPLTGPVKPVLA